LWSGLGAPEIRGELAAPPLAKSPPPRPPFGARETQPRRPPLANKNGNRCGGFCFHYPAGLPAFFFSGLVGPWRRPDFGLEKPAIPVVGLQSLFFSTQNNKTGKGGKGRKKGKKRGCAQQPPRPRLKNMVSVCPRNSSGPSNKTAKAASGADLMGKNRPAGVCFVFRGQRAVVFFFFLGKKAGGLRCRAAGPIRPLLGVRLNAHQPTRPAMKRPWPPIGRLASAPGGLAASSLPFPPPSGPWGVFGKRKLVPRKPLFPSVGRIKTRPGKKRQSPGSQQKLRPARHGFWVGTSNFGNVRRGPRGNALGARVPPPPPPPPPRRGSLGAPSWLKKMYAARLPRFRRPPPPPPPPPPKIPGKKKNSWGKKRKKPCDGADPGGGGGVPLPSPRKGGKNTKNGRVCGGAKRPCGCKKSAKMFDGPLCGASPNQELVPPPPGRSPRPLAVGKFFRGQGMKRRKIQPRESRGSPPTSKKKKGGKKNCGRGAPARAKKILW